MKPGNGELSITVGETYRSLHSDFQLIARSSKLRMIRETSSDIVNEKFVCSVSYKIGDYSGSISLHRDNT